MLYIFCSNKCNEERDFEFILAFDCSVNVSLRLQSSFSRLAGKEL